MIRKLGYSLLLLIAALVFVTFANFVVDLVHHDPVAWLILCIVCLIAPYIDITKTK